MDLPTDVKLLQHTLQDTTERLQRAAHLGLQLSQQNERLHQQLQQLTATQHDLQQRIQLLERDRKWQHSQSLVVDQTQQTVEEMQKSQRTLRQQQTLQEKKIRLMEARLNEPSEPADESQREVARVRGMVERRMGRMEKQMDELRPRLDALEDRLAVAQRQLSGHMQQTGKSLNKLQGRLALIESATEQTAQQLADLSSHHQDLRLAFRQTLSEYAHFTTVDSEAPSRQGETLASILPMESPKPALNQIISPTASIGVGWGKYWEARLGF